MKFNNLINKLLLIVGLGLTSTLTMVAMEQSQRTMTIKQVNSKILTLLDLLKKNTYEVEGIKFQKLNDESTSFKIPTDGRDINDLAVKNIVDELRYWYLDSKSKGKFVRNQKDKTMTEFIFSKAVGIGAEYKNNQLEGKLVGTDSTCKQEKSTPFIERPTKEVIEQNKLAVATQIKENDKLNELINQITSLLGTANQFSSIASRDKDFILNVTQNNDDMIVTFKVPYNCKVQPIMDDEELNDKMTSVITAFRTVYLGIASKLIQTNAFKKLQIQRENASEYLIGELHISAKKMLDEIAMISYAISKAKSENTPVSSPEEARNRSASFNAKKSALNNASPIKTEKALISSKLRDLSVKPAEELSTSDVQRNRSASIANNSPEATSRDRSLSFNNAIKKVATKAATATKKSASSLGKTLKNLNLGKDQN